MFPKLHLLIVGLTISVCAYAQTVITGGEVAGKWTIESSPFQINGDITIPSDSTLYIDPGVLVEFQRHHRLTVLGQLLAIGTPMDSIIFTISDTTGFRDFTSKEGGWNGIRFIDTPSDQDSSKIMYCQLQYGKAVADFWHDNAGGAIAVVNFDKVVLAHNTFAHNMAGGTDAPAGGAIHLAWSDIMLHHNVIINNTAEIGGAIQVHESNPTFRHNVIIQNTAREGGGISMAGSSPSFHGDIIMNNIASQSAGGLGIFEASDTCRIDSVTFIGNRSNWGGGVGTISSNIIFQRCRFESNSVSWLGGSIAADYANLEIKQCQFTRDTTADSGGALHLDHGDVLIYDSRFDQNKAYKGGAINSAYTKLEIDQTKFIGNEARGNGGALHIWNGDLFIRSSEFDRNRADVEGGGLYFQTDTFAETAPFRIQLMETVWNSNFAHNGGGVIFRQYAREQGSMLSIEKTVFSNNITNVNSAGQIASFENFRMNNCRVIKNISMTRTSGIVFNNSAGLVTNTLFSGNQAVSGTGACAINNVSTIHFMHCGFVDNHSTLSPFHVRRGSKATATNCIFWNNSAWQINLSSTADSLPSELTLNYCLVQDGQDSIRVDDLSTLHWSMGNLNADPLFVNPPDNYALTEGSPAISAGTPNIEIDGLLLVSPSEDINGDTRPSPAGSQPDIGPFESPLGQPTFVRGWSEKGPEFNINPNPVSDHLYLDFTIDLPGLLEIKLYTMAGEYLTTLFREHYDPGVFKKRWDVSFVPIGVHLIMVRTGNFVYSKKIARIR